MTDLRTLACAIIDGSVPAAVEAIADAVVIHDQRLGRLAGASASMDWVTDSSRWLQKLDATPHEIAHLETEHRSILELSLNIRTGDEVVDLPYVLVAERSAEGTVEIRTYHSTWPYTGSHVFRAPPLAGRLPEPVPEIFRWYIDRVSAGDVDAVLGRFTPDGYVREPSGDRWKHQGPEDRAAFYGHLVHAPRATFDLVTSTVCGDLIAVEYGFSYGPVPKVGGICIMEVAADRIHAVRITDDVSV